MKEEERKSVGISHAPLNREQKEQEKVPPKGKAKAKNAHDKSSKGQSSRSSQD